MEFIQSLLTTIALAPLCVKLSRLKCLSGVNSVIAIGCSKIKKSPSAIANALLISLLCLFAIISLIIKVPISPAIANFFAHLLSFMFILTLSVKYYAQNRDESSKEFVIRKWSDIKRPLIIFSSILIAFFCGYIFIEIPSIYYELTITVMILILMLPCYKILNSSFDIIAYLISKTLAVLFIKYIQKALSIKLVWYLILVSFVQINILIFK